MQAAQHGGIRSEQMAGYLQASSRRIISENAEDIFKGGIVLANVHTHPTEHTLLGKNGINGAITDLQMFMHQHTDKNSDGNRATWQGANYTMPRDNIDFFSPLGINKSTNNLTTRYNLIIQKNLNY